MRRWASPGIVLGLDSAAPSDQSLLPSPTVPWAYPGRTASGTASALSLCVFQPLRPTEHTWTTIFVVVTCHNQGWLTRSNASAYPPGPLMGPPPGCLVTVWDAVSYWPTILIAGAVKSQHDYGFGRGRAGESASNPASEGSQSG